MPAHPDDWKKAKKLCRLNEADIRAAKELGFRPKSLILNIPTKDQQWKLPVKAWIWDLWEAKIGAKTGRTRPASAGARHSLTSAAGVDRSAKFAFGGKI